MIFKRHLSPLGMTIAEYCVENANALLPQLKAQWLAELLRDAPVVEGRSVERNQGVEGMWMWSTNQGLADCTHTARLVDVKEIG